MVKTNR